MERHNKTVKRRRTTVKRRSKIAKRRTKAMYTQKEGVKGPEGA